MNSRLLKGFSEQEKIEFKRAFKDAEFVMDRLKSLLESDLENSIEEMSKKDNFFMPAWSEYQAHKLGEQRALKSLLKLIEE